MKLVIRTEDIHRLCNRTKNVTAIPEERIALLELAKQDVIAETHNYNFQQLLRDFRNLKPHGTLKQFVTFLEREL